jgi:hypothetical protein
MFKDEPCIGFSTLSTPKLSGVSDMYMVHVDAESGPETDGRHGFLSTLTIASVSLFVVTLCAVASRPRPNLGQGSIFLLLCAHRQLHFRIGRKGTCDGGCAEWRKRPL